MIKSPVLYLLSFIVVFGACQQTPKADIIYFNANIYTVDSLIPLASAMAVKDNILLSVGTEKDVQKYNGDKTKNVDLKGRFVLPGFIEGHGHFGGLGKMVTELNLLETTSWQEVENLLKEELKSNQLKWVFGGGWHQEKWDSLPDMQVDGYPNATTMDAFTTNRPVILKHASGHGLFANTTAMKISGITKETPDPDGGRIVRNEYGEPTGIFEEKAQSLILEHYYEWVGSLDPETKYKTALKQIKFAEDECLSHGITSFQDAGSSFEDIELYRSLSESDDLRIRLWVMLRESYNKMKDRMTGFPYINPENTHFTCRAIKSEIDGALGSYGAWLLDEYSDKPGFHGQNTTDVDEVRKIADLAIKHNMQLCVHAIGDKGNQVILDMAEEKMNGKGPSLRWRMEHAQHLHPEDIPRFAKLGLIASMQSVHCTSDAPFVEKRLGHERAQDGAYVWQSLLQSGAVVSNGTDVPVEKIDPIANYYAAVTRKRTDGSLTFFPEQVMTREQAIYSMTMACAYAGFEEDIKGSISVGKLADFIVLDQNILTCEEEDILKTKVLETYVGGIQMYPLTENL
jgi:predicted amidohydrolase YtcJ